MTATSVLDLGGLGPFHAAGVLALPDVHVAVALCRVAGRPVDDPVALGAALCVRALRQGSVCIDVTADPSTWAPEEEDLPEAEAMSLPWPEPESWRAALAASPLVAVGSDGAPDRPLRLVGDRLYLQRYWADEQLIRRELRARSRLLGGSGGALAESIGRLFPRFEPDQQRLAAASAAVRGVTIIAGGPGTGKTTTVARLIAVLRALHGPDLTIGLAAPTGKAAARLQEAVSDAVARLPQADRERVGEVPAATLHRLLGWRRDSSVRFRHDRGNPLPHDVIVVDETSMVSLPMMARLLEALRPDAQLVLVGDPDQLASVDAGAVLGDVVAATLPWSDPAQAAEFARTMAVACPREADLASQHPGVVVLDHNYRFDGPIADLARAIRDDRPDEALALLTSGGEQLEFLDPADPAQAAAAIRLMHADVVGQALRIREAADGSDPAAALDALEEFRVLCAHRRGPFGVAVWNAQLGAWVRDALPGLTTPGPAASGPTTSEPAIAGPSIASPAPADPAIADAGATAPTTSSARYPDIAAPAAPALAAGDGSAFWVGRPLLVLANDYAAEVYNGDTGVIVSTPRGPRAAFARGAEPLLVSPARLQHVETLHAMTIHRCQGSQFDAVTVVLPPPESPLLTRELLYTAVTRARHRVRIVGSPDAVRAGISRQVRRASGLREPAG